MSTADSRVAGAGRGEDHGAGAAVARRPCPRAPARLDQPGVQGLDEEGVRAERGRHARACLGGAARHLGDVALDVVAAAEEQGDEDGLRRAPGRRGCPASRGSFSSMWPRWTGEAGALFADAVQRGR